MKIAVYAIAKNEAANVQDWVRSMGEADEIYVLDTGSTDGTVEELRKRGVKVAQQVNEPFRFDVARNASLAMIPDDVDWCVCTDLDERFRKGWRTHIEAVSEQFPWCNSITGRFITEFNPDGTIKDEMDYWKIHKRDLCVWRAPIHEYLEWNTLRMNTECRDIILEHHPDTTKSRAQYLPMLEEAVKKDPNSRNLFYLAREYVFYSRWAAALLYFGQYLNHKQSNWDAERSWAMRYSARCLASLGEPQLAAHWYLKAALEYPKGREPLVEYAQMCYNNNDLREAVAALQMCVMRNDRPTIYFTETDCWNGNPEKLLAQWSAELEEQCSNGSIQ